VLRVHLGFEGRDVGIEGLVLFAGGEVELLGGRLDLEVGNGRSSLVGKGLAR